MTMQPAVSIAPHAEHERPLPTRLRWTIGYFRVTAILGAISLPLFLAVMLFGPGLSMPLLPRLLIAIAVGAFMSGCNWWTARLLGERRREGGWLALGTLLPPLAQFAMTGHSSTVTISSNLLFGAFGALAVLTSWRELD